MANVNTDIVTNFVAVPQVKNSSQQLHGVKRIAQGTIALAAGDLSAGDTVMLTPVPTNASISSIKLFNDDLDSGSTNTTDVGLYSTAIAAVDDDAALGNLQFTHGATAGNIVQFTSSKVDIGDVSYGDQDGIAMLEIPYTCVPDSAANAEFDLVYT